MQLFKCDLANLINEKIPSILNRLNTDKND